MRPRLALLALAIALVPQSPAWADPDTAVQLFLGPGSQPVEAGLRTAINASGRFRVVDSPVRLTPKLPDLVPDVPLTVAWRNSTQKRTEARWLILGAVSRERVVLATDAASEATTSYRVATRVLDLKLGDMGPVVTARSPDLSQISVQVIKYLRVANPLKGHVTAVGDSALYIDLGTRDGLAQGQTFQVKRQSGTINQQVATVVVGAAADWYAECQIQDQARGFSPQQGDAVIEDTTALLATH